MDSDTSDLARRMAALTETLKKAMESHKAQTSPPAAPPSEVTLPTAEQVPTAPSSGPNEKRP